MSDSNSAANDILDGVHFGPVGDAPPDWRKDKAVSDEVDPDDEEMEETPPEVIAVLGFDPKDAADS